MLGLGVLATNLTVATFVEAADNLGGAVAAVAIAPFIIVSIPPFGANVYYSTKDTWLSVAGDEPSEKSGRYEVYWTSWQAGLLVPLGTALTISTGGRDGYDGGLWSEDEASALFAASTWPAMLTAHGIWYGYPDKRDLSLAIAGTADGLLLAYDAHHLIAGKRVYPAYRMIEGTLGVGQIIYGLGRVVREDSDDDRMQLAALTPPFVMTLHAVLVSGEKADTSSRVRRFPLVMAQPVEHHGMMLSMSGAW